MASFNTPDGDLRQRVRRRLTPTTTFTALGAISALVLAGSMLTGKVSGKEGQSVNSSDARPLSIPSPVTLSNGFSGIVKQVGPAVVNINTESTPKAAAPSRRGNRRGLPTPTPPNGGGGGDEDGNDMQDFFNRFFGGGGGAQPDLGTRRALGSGFIVDPRGYIITNNHVIDKADRIFVKLSTDPDNASDEGRPAKVIGADPSTDIAVIKIESAQPLPTIKLGNSNGAQVGDWVLAIGSPFGLSKTVSAGIVSALNRSNLEGPSEGGVDQGQFQRFIQTDAAINPGNSGGPLVDMAGEVIGMNTAIYTQSAGSEGVGFALPSNILISVYNQLIGPSHKVTRGSIGIQFQATQNSAVGRVYGFTGGGVIISTVTPNGPAAKAGLQPKDIIVSVDGQAVKDGDELVGIISQKAPGSTVHLGYTRNGKRENADVTITDRAKLFADQGNNNDDNATPDQSDAGQVKLGITEQPVTGPQASKLGIHGGVVVTGIRPGSFAEQIGMPTGVVIVEINRKPVASEADYRAIVSGLKTGDDVVFVVRFLDRPQAGDSYIGGTLQ
jgi:serine protease Do